MYLRQVLSGGGQVGRSVQGAHRPTVIKTQNATNVMNVMSGNALATCDAPQEARSPDLPWGEQAPCSSPGRRIQKSIDYAFGGGEGV